MKKPTINKPVFERNMAITHALIACLGEPPAGCRPGTRFGLSPVQRRILAGLRNGNTYYIDKCRLTMVVNPGFDTVTLPVLEERGLIRETVEHDRPLEHRRNQTAKLRPLRHSDIEITELGLRILWAFDKRIERSKHLWKKH